MDKSLRKILRKPQPNFQHYVKKIEEKRGYHINKRVWYYAKV